MRFDEVKMEGPFYLELVTSLPTWSTSHRRRLVMIEDEDTGYSIYYGSTTGWRRLDFTFSGFQGDTFIENIYQNIANINELYNDDGTLNLSGADIYVGFDGENFFLTSSLPDQTDHGGKVLRTDGYKAEWYKLTAKDILPSQTGQQGRFLRTNGTNVRWSSVPSDLPAQGGNSGKVLSTDGSTARWTSIQESMGLPDKDGHAGEFLKVNNDEDALLWDSVLPENTTSIVKHLANDGNTTYWSSDIVPSTTGDRAVLTSDVGGNIEWSLVDILPEQKNNDGNVLATNGVFPFWTDVNVVQGLADLTDVNDDIDPDDSDMLIYDGVNNEWKAQAFSGNYVKTDGDSEPTEDNSWVVGTNEKRFKKIYSVCFVGTASQTQLADLAENYTCKDIPTVGKVLLISEDENFDCELSNETASDRILGIVSEAPGYLMNKDLSGGVAVGLKGRLPCWVRGPVKKGEPLVSYTDGCAISAKRIPDLLTQKIGSLLGRANEYIKEDSIKLIEVIV